MREGGIDLDLKLQDTGLHEFQGKLGITSKEIKDLRHGYIQNMIAEKDSPQKQEQREVILNFINKHHSAIQPMRFFSMPGGAWTFERQLLANRIANTQFVGIERNGTILHESLFFMPGLKRHQITEKTSYGSIYCWRSETASIFHGWCSTFVTLPGANHDYRSPKKTRKHWRSNYKNITAIWLDFPAQLCHEILFTLPRLNAICDFNQKEIPVVISFLKCRESRKITSLIEAFGSREETTLFFLNGGNNGKFRLVDTHEYQSCPNTRFLTLFCLMTTTKKN